MTSPRSEAPGALELVRQFVNTYDVEEGKDAVGNPALLGAWLAEHGLTDKGVRVTPKDHRMAIQTREALRSLLLTNNGEQPSSEAIENLNAVAESLPVAPRFQPDGSAQLEPRADGIKGALARILTIVLASMTTGTWSRLKACREHTCEWAFYDNSKNRSGSWCSMAVCGNRNKARSYRERKKRTPE